MSLKGFHLIFIIVAALFCAAFGSWAIFIEDGASGKEVTIIGYITLTASVALAAYAVYFCRKAKSILL
ncbi:hypothetical protein N9F48_03025 [Akkermansiaceae bacterium]|nr:hypothetical protein [Akkermansiaceae bacterium]MDA7935148.1 hypothetical protein [Akkermansiaceae bacterium]MDA8969021.1 hypothetical protein [Akkermansiaceae bacterium]MDA8975483.1 hypothetical protein [Akkermansiaceae bacterium]MDB4373593.1 hypothetical protein [Akkermansiaceae bacterium]